MNTFLQATLRSVIEQAVYRLLKADWSKIESLIFYYMNMDIPSNEKRDRVINDLRALGVDWATWLLGVGVDVLYAQITKKPLIKESS